jgi:hypothetical protein
MTQYMIAEVRHGSKTDTPVFEIICKNTSKSNKWSIQTDCINGSMLF